ncbi:hypothetical protein HD806DRAFT_162312 [Xylariaceae sp. AK1471]|nr:hypothetical protein HD806DRAFT_162312 [Xylariaceae sp. AK1471]
MPGSQVPAFPSFLSFPSHCNTGCFIALAHRMTTTKIAPAVAPRLPLWSPTTTTNPQPRYPQQRQTECLPIWIETSTRRSCCLTSESISGTSGGHTMTSTVAARPRSCPGRSSVGMRTAAMRQDSEDTLTCGGTLSRSTVLRSLAV